MLSVMAAVALAAAVQDPGQWQDFGAGRDGVRVAVNLDSIETGAQGPEAAKWAHSEAAKAYA